MPARFALMSQRNVYAAHRIEEHRTVPPIGAHVARLPDVLDLVHVPADEKRFQVLVQGRFDDERALCEGGAAPTHEAGLGRFHFDDDQPDAIRRRQNGLDVADLDRGRTFDGLLVRRGRSSRERSGQEFGGGQH
jgi:hypothetical protein